MTTLIVTKDQIREKIGKKWWLDDQQVLAAKLDYINGIDLFDQILDGKTLKQIDGVIHLEKYPKGLLFKIAKGFGGFKTHSFPVAKNEIQKVVLAETQGGGGQLTFDLKDGNKIEFQIKKSDIWEVKDFLKEIKLNYETEKIKKPAAPKEKKEENTQKHGVPTLISFFVPGVGQLIKGHMMKAFGIWVIGGLVGFFFWWTYFAPFIVWVWNVYDAYNSNSDWGSSDKDTSEE
jgi:hypothetical protein